MIVKIGFGGGFKRVGFSSSKFSPLDLFKDGKQGVWYDPSDKSTLFQDVAGTVPVTKDGDPVALMLDKSQGGTVSTNLVPNGDFSSNDLSMWTADPIYSKATKEWVNGELHITATTTGEAGYYVLQVPSIIGETYVFSASWTRVGGGRFSVSNGPNGASYNNNAAISNPEIIFKATGTSIYLRVGALGGISTQVVDNINLRKLSGNPAFQTVSAARPIYKKDVDKAWLYNDKIDDKLLVELPAMTATVVKATDEGVSIDYPVNITAGDYPITSTSALGRDYGHLIINKELSASEITQVTNYFNAKRGV